MYGSWTTIRYATSAPQKLPTRTEREFEILPFCGHFVKIMGGIKRLLLRTCARSELYKKVSRRPLCKRISALSLSLINQLPVSRP